LVNPVIYAEDGSWAGLGLTQGWYQALAHARNDYLVVGNVLLLWLAATCSTALFGNPLAHLPESIAVVSYLFYSGTAVLTIWAFRDSLPGPLRAATFLLLLMLPLGMTQNVIIGRLVQAGFVMPYVATLLLYAKGRQYSGARAAVIDVLILIAALTNPVVIALTLVCLAVDALASASTLRSVLARNKWLAASMAAAAILVFSRMLGKDRAHLLDFDPTHLFEAVCARSLLYPFVFPWYDKLHDAATAMLLVIWLGVVVLGFFASRDKSARRAMLFLACGLATTATATFIMRPGLTSLLRGYSSTFPDQYFMGLNIFSLVLVMLALSQIVGLIPAHKNIVAGLAAAPLVALYFCHAGMIFESSGSRFPMKASATFDENLRAAKWPHGSAVAQIPIAPEDPPWSMKVPVRWLDDLRQRR
jgi:hypothetical protein